MQSKWLAKLGAGAWSSLKTTVGAALVLTACAGVAFAQPGPPPAPEMDPGTMASAAALATGGVLLLRSRFRR